MGESYTVLSEQDYLDLIDIIHQLGRCESGDDLQKLAESTLLPLFRADGFGAAFTDLDIVSAKQEPARIFISAGIPEKEKIVGQQLQPYFQSITGKFANSLRATLLHDIDIPSDNLQTEIDEFFSDHPEIDREDYPGIVHLKRCISMADPPDYSIGVGFSRRGSNDAPFTYRDLRMAELLRPSLIHTVKYIALRREITTFSALAEHLSDVPVPLALVRPEGGILFCNSAFEKTFSMKPGNRVPDEVVKQIQKLNDVLSPSDPGQDMVNQSIFFRWDQTVYRVTMTRLDPTEDLDGRCWLLKFKPALEPRAKIDYTLNQAQLTLREIEVASLVCDGFPDKEIAQRLFISPNTVNNHLKKIFRKLQVTSRVQLVNCLHGIMKGNENSKGPR